MFSLDRGWDGYLLVCPASIQEASEIPPMKIWQTKCLQASLTPFVCHIFAVPIVSFYFKNPLMIWASASISLRPRVISFSICSPAIFPMAASWIRAASGTWAVISGMAWILA